jgi:oligopeptide/dipeptide ABC transporter ATP-binding protein
MIALALACRPQLLLADEPTTALDATVQIQILLLLRELQRELGLAILFVTHDIGAAIEVADRIAVMYAGRIVEEGPAAAIVRQPRHPYTIALLQGRAGGSGGHALARGARLRTIGGSPPDLSDLPPGCAFAPRCAYAQPECRQVRPEAVRIAADHGARCLHTDATRDAMAGAGTVSIGVYRHEAMAAACASCRLGFAGSFVELAVTDSGAGIAPELVERIFDPFFTTKAPGKGSGMGLSTVHGIVHEYGGHVVVDSKPGEGTAFRVLWPASTAVARAIPVA